MPELPEVETVRRGLQRLIVGKKVARVTHDTPKSFPNAAGDVREFLVGSTILEARRRAKVLLIDLDTGYTLVIHLKMTGQLVFIAEKNEKGNMKNDELHWGGGHPNDSLVHDLPDKSTRVEFTFTDETKLFFNDQRKFGWVKLYPTVEVPNIDFMKRVGPEPLEDDFTADIFYERLQRRKNTTIKAAILDQSVLAGVGNIYADEALWGAKIHPSTRVRDVSPSSVQRLLSSVKSVMNLSIDKGGSSSHTYMDAEGNKGSYLLFANVFRREGLACNRCGTTIEKTRVAGRGTHICPHCQILDIS